MNKILISVGTRRLFLLWVISFLILLVLLMFMTIGGALGESAKGAWEWFFPVILPVFTLVTSLFFAEKHAKTEKSKHAKIDRSKYRWGFWLSLVYLVMVAIPILLHPFFERSDPLVTMLMFNWGLGPFQALVASVIGLCFARNTE